jgi:hypothetical protein
MNNLSYQPNFGEHGMIQGSEQFPQLIIRDPSTVMQLNIYDCSFGSISSPFALVSQFFENSFLQNQCIKKGEENFEEHCYYLPVGCSLKVF